MRWELERFEANEANPWEGRETNGRVAFKEPPTRFGCEEDASVATYQF
jgi:hypothetical protein